MIVRKTVAIVSEDVLSTNSALQGFVGSLETFLFSNYQSSFKLSKKELSGFGSIMFDVVRLGGSLEKTCQELRESGAQLRDLRLDLMTLEPTHAEAAPLRHVLDGLMDTLEIPKDYFWLETHFPGEAFREGLHRFYEKEKDVLGALIFEMDFLNRHLIKEVVMFSLTDPVLYTLPSVEVLRDRLRCFSQLQASDFDASSWERFDRRSVIIEGRQLLTNVWFEFITKKDTIVACSEKDNRVFPMDQVIYPDHHRVRTRLHKVQRELEHLIVRYEKLNLNGIDTPPDYEFMSSLPAVTDAARVDAKFVQKRKLERLYPTPPEYLFL